MLTIIMPDGAKLGGDKMASEFESAALADRIARELCPSDGAAKGEQLPSTGGNYRVEGKDLIPMQMPPFRGVSLVAAELEHAQEQAARVKPLREELDQLLGRKVRARKVSK